MKKILMILASAMLLFACSDDKGATEGPVGPEAKIGIGVDKLAALATGDFEQGLNEVTVTSSGNWRLTGLKTWCTPSAVEGRSGDKVTFTAEENTSGAPRSITYTFFCGNKAVKLVVTQQQNDVIDLSQDLFEVGSGGLADIRVKVLSTVGLNVRVEYDQPGEPWILPAVSAKSMSLSYLYYSVPANDTYAARSGRIVVSSEDGETARTITLRQAQNDELKTDVTSFKQPVEASTIRMTVWSNIPYEVQIPDDADWITLEAQPTDPAEWSSQELVFQLAASEKYRIAAVSLVAKDGSKRVPVGIQQGEPLVFDVPDKVFREYLLKEKYIEVVDGGYTTTAAGVAVTKLDVYQFYTLQPNSVFSAEGVEYFPNLTEFDARYSRIRSLDISKNLKLSNVTACGYNALETFKVSPAVTQILFSKQMYDMYSGSSSTRYWAQSTVITGENVTTIDLSQNRLQTIDVSGCPSLTTLKCTQASGYTLRSITLSESQRGKVTIDFAGAQLIYK